MRRARHAKGNRFIPEKNRRPVGSLTADELHTELVTDAVKWNHATDLIRFTEACIRIGQLRRCGADAAFKAVQADIEARRGPLSMPLG